MEGRVGEDSVELGEYLPVPYLPPSTLTYLIHARPLLPVYSNMRKKQYKRPIEYPYDNAYFLADAANAAALYPKFLNIGG